MSAVVARRQSASPVQAKRASIANLDVKSEGTNASPPREPNTGEIDTPSQYLMHDKYLAIEHNPFEQSFANPATSSQGSNVDTSKPALPSVVEMFTPGGTNQYEQYNFVESLRHGPLSPNLLPGPQIPLPFDPTAFRTGLTPNESNIRTGLTPGNTPSFPLLPTPGTAALLAAYPSDTTNTLTSLQQSSFSVPSFAPVAPRPADVFGENQAANGLVFLAQTSQQQAQQAIPPAVAPREELGKRTVANNSKVNAYQDPVTLMNNKKREDTTPKNTRSKKLKPDESMNLNTKETNIGKKTKSKSTVETDDDKRRNFLERNRQAALKCRQRKKQWLSSLQTKVEWYTRENEMLSGEIGQLREQVTTLKTILAAHKDCPVAQQNGATPEAIAQAVGQAGVYSVHAYR